MVTNQECERPIRPAMNVQGELSEIKGKEGFEGHAKIIVSPKESRGHGLS